MKDVILAGNAVSAEILLGYLRGDPRYRVVGAVVDDNFVAGGRALGVHVAGMSRAREIFAPDRFPVLMAVGYDRLNSVRESLFLRLKALGYSFETYIHPDARIYTSEPIGEGSLILSSAVIEPHAKIGADTVVWANTTIAHHAEIGDHCWIAAGSVISGEARVLNNTFVGVNVTVVNKVTVGASNILGAGALVTRDTRPNTVHLARSAEPFRFSAEEYVKHFGV